MSEPRFSEIQATIFAMLSAMQVALRALAKTHPHPQALIEAFRLEHEETLSVLSTKPLPPAALEAYREVLRGIAPNQDDWLEH